MANDLLQETGTFKPPMPKKFGIERNDHNRVKPRRSDFTDLTPAFLEKMKGLPFGDSFCSDWMVELLLATGPGDAVILHAGEFPGAVSNWSQMFQWKVESGVAIKLPVRGVTRITSLCAPTLSALITIARKSVRPARRVTRCINRSTRTRFS